MSAAMAISAEEVAASILQPYFDDARTSFAGFEVEPGQRLSKAAKTRFVVDAGFHDTDRHFAATRDDGLLMYFAPEYINLPVETATAIMAHEFGHALDFLYPGHWLMPAQGPGKATWIGPPGQSKAGRKWLKLWRSRTRDQVEWAADGIAQVVIGRRIGYCGDCMLQCFRGKPRPKGLR